MTGADGNPVRSPQRWELDNCQGIDHVSGKSCQGKLSMAYLKFAAVSVFSGLFWLYIAILAGFFSLFSHF